MRHAQGKAPEVTSTALTAMRRLYCSPDGCLRRLCMSRHHLSTPAFQPVKVEGKSVDQVLRYSGGYLSHSSTLGTVEDFF